MKIQDELSPGFSVFEFYQTGSNVYLIWFLTSLSLKYTIMMLNIFSTQVSAVTILKLI